MTRKKSPAPKAKKILGNLKKNALQYMEGRRYRPMTQEELQDKLSIPEQVKPDFHQAIQELIQENEIEVHSLKLQLKKPPEEVLTGIIRMHHKGFGFVIPDNPSQCPQDIFIPKHLTDNAVEGDHVEVVLGSSEQSEKGPEGRVVGILKRARKHIAGTINQITANAEIYAYVPLLGTTKTVLVQTTSEQTLKVGDRVILKVIKWGSDRDPTLSELSHILGHISDPKIDNAAAIEEFDLNGKFNKLAIEQAKEYGEKVPLKEQKKRVDLTGLETFTIDPDTAKDFDDALSISKDRKGNYQLAVHIADVAHYVDPGTPLDKEASERCNSTYFPGFCLPMLPEELSNHLCSLKPDVIRLTVSVLMDFDKTGALLKYEICRSFIHSQKRFTYGEALEVLEGKLKSKHAKALKLMVDLCHLLKQKRGERGSIDFAMPEAVLVIDDKGMPTGVKRVEYDITHQLVEEFMLKANEIVATDLTLKGKPVLYRVHEEPSEDNFKDFLSFARSLGFQVPVKPTIQELRALFESAKETPYLHQLSIGFIRSMKLAQYSPENAGHFGLALEYYCHFTSPIRRYSDLITQRVLFTNDWKEIDFEAIAEKCSEQERLSFRAEQSVKTLKKLRLLAAHLERDPNHEFPALITRIKPFGLHFELDDLMLDGFLHISELENDYFIYDEQRNVLYGKSSGKTHRLGQRIDVRLVEVDLIQLESRWELAGANVKKRGSFPKRRRR